tara:strand:- start:385 stop:1194 length:810 start_codon:yes stop_codon:yes gene_type:complete
MVMNKINEQLKKLNKKGEIIVVNDFSKEHFNQFEKFENINLIKIINLNENVGSQKAISIGLNYINKNYDASQVVTVLDSDGEDDVSQLPKMIDNAIQNPDRVIVSCRTKRKEKIIFKVLYFFHKVITFLATFNWISFGNYSSFMSKNITSILKNDKSWLAFSSCLAFNCNLKRLYAPRKNRLIGKSKLSFGSLVNHALRVNAVFLTRVSLLFLLYISSFVILKKKFLFTDYFIIFLLVLFYFFISFTYRNNNQKKFKDSLSYISSVDKF